MSQEAATPVPTAGDLQQALRAARQQMVEVTKAHAIMTRAQLVLEQAVEAEAFLGSHVARVTALEARADALVASIASLEGREAKARTRMEGAEAAAQAEVDQAEADKNRALEVLAADWATARSQHEQALVNLANAHAAHVASYTQEAQDLESRVARARQDLAALKAAL